MSNNMGERLPMGFLITTLSHEFRTRTTAALEPYDLSTREFGLLVRLLHHGTLTQSKLGQLHHTDRTSMVSCIDDLEAKGLVERRRDPNDRRAYLVSLTDHGRSTLVSAGKLVEEAERDITASLTDRQREDVRMLLTRAVSDIQSTIQA
jgi:DNA-binding MarR family transcriptional regulator